MTLHGLFIGVDRYQSKSIGWLDCAVRDATALHTLFTDNLGGKTLLLRDEEATRENIKKQFEGLALCEADDVVVIFFSGHGSETHELVTYDADPWRLAETAIPLEELTEWFSKIPARRLLLVLDCCFAGGAGAKVLQVPAKPKDIKSEEELLSRLSGEGRLIFTAATANQYAWEMRKHGHGLLTHFLLQALQGAEEVRQSGQVSIMKLLEYVTQRVVAEANQFGQPQYPTIRGTIEGELLWPIFTPGPLYLSAFPEYVDAEASEDIQSLTTFGFPNSVLDAWGQVIPSLNKLQLDAINSFGLLKGENLLISAPTSSGKTMIGELAAIYGTLRRKRAVFLLPLKALVNDKYRYFNETYKPFGLKIIRATGDTSDEIPELMRGQYDICLLTYEKFAALILANSHILHGIGTVVVDEVQMIADPSRGLNLEFLLTLIRMKRKEGIEPQLIALSAVIGDTNGFDRWLSARLLLREERPVPLNEGIIRYDGSYRRVAPDGTQATVPAIRPEPRGKSSSQDWIIPLVRKLVLEGKQIIVFRETKGEARGCANYLAGSLGLPPANEALQVLSSADPSMATDQLKSCLQHGVAFHIADLDPAERSVVEVGFRKPKSTIRVIAATTTLAMGVNTPAECVVICGLEHPGEQAYSIAEYKNMVGRAGRLGYSTEGSSYLITTSASEEHSFWNKYVLGKPEDLISRFTTTGDPRSLILRTLAAAQRSADGGIRPQDIVEFLEGSFGAFLHAQLHGQSPWSEAQLEGSLCSLREHGLVETNEDSRYTLTSLGRFAGESGVEVESIVRLVDTFKSLSPESITDPVLIAATQVTKELDDVTFPMNRKSTQSEPQAWSSALRGQGVPQPVFSSFHRGIKSQYESVLRAKKAVACLFWITTTPIQEIERTLTQFGGVFGGAAGPLRNVSSRTRDLLPAVAKVAEFVHPGLALADRCNRLLTRLEAGIPAEAVELASYAGSQLSRGDYLNLIKANLISLQMIGAAPDADILQHLGNDPNKLYVVRTAVEAAKDREQQTSPIVLAPYEA